MTAPAPCKPLLVCGTGIYFGSFAHPLYRELKHLFNRCDSRANCTHSARAKVCKLRAIGPGITSIEEVLEIPVERMSKGAKIYSSSTQGGAYMELEQSSPEIACLLIW